MTKDLLKNADCLISPVVSRICERGSKGCFVKHDQPSQSAEPIATLVAPDPYDEREGVWFSLEDAKRLQALPAGTKLYDHPLFTNEAPTQQEKNLEDRVDELCAICSEAYQIVGILADEAGRFDDPQVIKILDNLSEQKMKHVDVLPFASISEEAPAQQKGPN